MAEAFARIYGGKGVEAYSAGSRPSGHVNPKAVEVMRELDYDLNDHWSVGLTEIPEVEYDFVATMGCGDACPNVRGKCHEDWAIPDPKNMRLDELREVRNLIEEKVKAMLARI
jgi:protein-tyrosine-phosphatase